jgi:hypothetical protein
MMKYSYIKIFTLDTRAIGLYSLAVLTVSAIMRRGMDLVLWSNLLGMELAEHFMHSQLYITSVSGC